MSKKVKIVLNYGEIGKQLLRSSQARSICEKEAKKLQSALGEGYEVESGIGLSAMGDVRAYANVEASTSKAKEKELKDNSMLKALGSKVKW